MRNIDEAGGESERDDEQSVGPECPGDDYWGEVAIHFSTGEPLLLSITEGERGRLSRQLKSAGEFFHIFSRSNQMIAVRRAAVADMCLADDESDTYGPDHHLYQSGGVWQVIQSPDFWRIAGDLLGETDIEEIEERFGKDEVTTVARTIGLNMPDDIGGLIKAGKVDAANREAVLADAARMLETMEHLTRQITWQLSVGKIRRSPCGDGMNLSRFSWIEQARDPVAPGRMLIVNDPDSYMSFINLGALDYISLPRHLYFAWKERAPSQVQDFLVEAHPISQVGDHVTGSLAEPKATSLTRPFSCWQVCGL